MAGTGPESVLQLIRQIVSDGRMRAAADQELLRRFLGEGDEAAFQEMLRRHGPMVLDVCRGVLTNEADLEDAFQATFLVLAGRAGSIRKHESVGSWLHGVAYRTALKAREEAARRREHEGRAPEREAPDFESPTWAEVRQVVHEELGRMSDRYRGPLALCYLQGKTQDEAAPELGLSKGTLKRRLERARALLRERLVRRGLGPTGLLLAAAWPAAQAACVPQAWVLVTTKAAASVAAGRAVTAAASAKVAALTDGVLRSMFLTKLKVAVLVAVAVLGLGAAALAHRVTEEQPAPAAPQADAERPKTVLLTGRLVKAVDARKRTVRVSPNLNHDKLSRAQGRGALPDQTFEVPEGAAVEIDGKPGRLADFPSRGPVSLRVSADLKTAHSIRTHGANTRGRVTAVDAVEGAVTLDVEGAPVSLTLPVPKGASVEIAGKPGKLADLAPGTAIHILLAADLKTVRRIHGENTFHDTADLKALDLGKGTLTVVNEEGEWTYNLAKDAKVVVGGKAGVLADLKEGMELDLGTRGEEKTRTVVMITARRF